MAMGMMTEYYHFIFTTLVTYLRVLAWVGVGLPWKKVSLVGTGAVARRDPGWTCLPKVVGVAPDKGTKISLWHTHVEKWHFVVTKGRHSRTCQCEQKPLC